MATLNIPSDIMLPMVDIDDREFKLALLNALKENHIKMTQVLTEIESKLP